MKVVRPFVCSLFALSLSAFASVTVSSPAPNTSVGSPVHYTATASTSTCGAGVASMGIYVNNVLKYVVPGRSLNTSLAFSPGKYYTVVQEWDRCGGATKTAIPLTVGSGSSGISVAAPNSGSTVNSPVVYTASATSSCSKGVAAMGVYVNNQLKYVAYGNSLNTSVSLSPGAYNTVVQDWDYCGGSATHAVNITVAGTSTAAQVPSSRHIVMVMEENTGYSSVVGNGGWPNLNSLIAHGALATHDYANSHPSIGNYFMLTTGQILTTNDSSTQVWNVPSLARQMLAAGVKFRVYAEGISQGYVGGNTGAYLVRHNPFALLSDIHNNATVANQVIWPFSQFAKDLASGNLPEFSFIVPNVNDDAHNGSPQQADSWLQSNVVEPLANDRAFQPGGDGMLVVGFDEAADSDTSYGGGHISPVFWGPIVRDGYRQQSSTIYQHQSLLLTIDRALGLPNPPGAAAKAPAMGEFFVQK